MQLDLGGVEAIQAALLEAPRVVDSLEEAGSQAGAVSEWMRRLETLLAAKRLAVAAAVASQRSVLIAARRGRIHQDIEILGKPGRSKLILATASMVLERTVSEVRAVLDPEKERFVEGMRLAMQLVAVAQAKGVVAPDPGTPPKTESVARWLDSASADPDLTGGFANLAALVGRSDSLTLLVRILGQTR